MTPLAPGSTIGILGGGQLGRMLALAAARLGFDVAILDPEPDCPASRVCVRHLCAAYDDPEALALLARMSGVVTLEFENVPAGALAILIGLGVPVAPGARALADPQPLSADGLDALASPHVDEDRIGFGLGFGFVRVPMA